MRTEDRDKEKRIGSGERKEKGKSEKSGRGARKGALTISSCTLRVPKPAKQPIKTSKKNRENERFS